MPTNISIIQRPWCFDPLIDFPFGIADLFDDARLGHLINPLRVGGDIGKTGNGGVQGAI